jgi:hypothetical protein
MFPRSELISYPHGIDDLLEVIRQIEVFTESLLLVSSGSGVAVVTEAVLVMTPASLGITSIWISAIAPLSISPR